MKIKAGDAVIISFFLLIIAVSIFFLHQFSSSSGNAYASIMVKDTEYVYPLDKDCLLEFQGEMGKSVLEIKNGTIRFLESTCYDSTCIKMGEAGENKAKYLACLPNLVIVTIKGETSGKKTGSEVLDEY